METATATKATKKNMRRFLQCRLRYGYRFPSRGEQRKVKGVLEEIKDEDGEVERRLPTVELPKKGELSSVTIGPLNDEQIERLEGNPERNQPPDPMFKHLRETGQVRWLHAKPGEDKSDREKLEDSQRENAELRAKIAELEGKAAPGDPQTARGKRFAALEAARLRQKEGLPLSDEDRALLASIDDFGVARL
jgi:hypothetical protein